MSEGSGSQSCFRLVDQVVWLISVCTCAYVLMCAHSCVFLERVTGMEGPCPVSVFLRGVGQPGAISPAPQAQAPLPGLWSRPCRPPSPLPGSLLPLRSVWLLSQSPRFLGSFMDWASLCSLSLSLWVLESGPALRSFWGSSPGLAWRTMRRCGGPTCPRQDTQVQERNDP